MKVRRIRETIKHSYIRQCFKMYLGIMQHVWSVTKRYWLL